MFRGRKIEYFLTDDDMRLLRDSLNKFGSGSDDFFAALQTLSESMSMLKDLDFGPEFDEAAEMRAERWSAVGRHVNAMLDDWYFMSSRIGELVGIDGYDLMSTLNKEPNNR